MITPLGISTTAEAPWCTRWTGRRMATATYVSSVRVMSARTIAS